MTATLAAIRRHPLKGVGREALAATRLSAGDTLPWDRTWAVAHEAARLQGGAWVPCGNFVRGAKAPGVMAVTAAFDPQARRLTLHHPDRGSLTLDPDGDAGPLVDWLRPLVPENRPAPAGVVRAQAAGFTDSPFPSISLGNLASLRALSQRAGRPLSPERFRANLWLEGLAPWAEVDLVGRRLRVGGAVLELREAIHRCRATHADPETGRLDTDVLALLADPEGRSRFGVYAVVIEGGPVGQGDPVEVLA